MESESPIPLGMIQDDEKADKDIGLANYLTA